MRQFPLSGEILSQTNRRVKTSDDDLGISHDANISTSSIWVGIFSSPRKSFLAPQFRESPEVKLELLKVSVVLG